MTSGRQSTEFWSLIALGLLIVSNGTVYVDLPWQMVQWYGGVVATYIGGRSWVKARSAAPVVTNPERREP